VREIIALAVSVESVEGETVDWTKTGSLTYLRILRAYDHVLRRRQLVPEMDTFYHQFIFKLGQEPAATWFEKYEMARQVK
jgi:hypothetical protein